MEIHKLTELATIKSFIEASSYIQTSYLYKLPQNYDDIDTLLTKPIHFPGVFACADNNNDIKAILFAFSYAKDCYKVIGPFTKGEHDLTVEDFQALFNALNSNVSAHSIFNFSFEEGLQTYYPLMDAIHAHYNFTDYYLEAYKQTHAETINPNIIEYHTAFYRHFAKLHHDTFKHGAHTAEELIATLDDYHRLFLFVSEGILKGYLYLQIDTTGSHAEIKYFSSHSDYRFMGIGFDLLSYGLNYAFKHYEIKKVHFKIRSKNTKLVSRFNELGFKVNYEYKKFKLEQFTKPTSSN